MGIITNYLFKNEYCFHDTPDGEDCFKKTWYVTKYCGLYGLLYTNIDVMLFSHPKGYAQTLGRYAYITFPLMGMGAAFAATTCATASIRNKDDQFNYWFGGLASGAVFGVWQKSIKAGVISGIMLGLAGMVHKDSYVNNWNFFYDVPQKWGDFWSLEKDYSIMKDPGYNWKSEWQK